MGTGKGTENFVKDQNGVIEAANGGKKGERNITASWALVKAISKKNKPGSKKRKRLRVQAVKVSGKSKKGKSVNKKRDDPSWAILKLLEKKGVGAVEIQGNKALKKGAHKTRLPGFVGSKISLKGGKETEKGSGHW